MEAWYWKPEKLLRCETPGNTDKTKAGMTWKMDLDVVSSATHRRGHEEMENENGRIRYGGV